MTRWMKKGVAAMCAVVLAVGLAACGGRKEDGGRESDEKSEAAMTPPPTEAPTEAPALTSRFADVKPGDVIEFGTYSDTSFRCNQPRGSSIQWVVLENNRSEIFVVSRYVLDFLSGDLDKIHDMSSLPGRSSLTMPALSNPDPTKEETEKGAVTWETSTARAWLNQYFYEHAFSEEEKKYIVESRVKTENTKKPVNPEKTTNQLSSKYTYGGNITYDFIFLPSYEEAKEYLEPLGILDVVPTKEYEEVVLDTANKYPLEDICFLLRSPAAPCTYDTKNAAGRADGMYYSSRFRVCKEGSVEADFSRFSSEVDEWNFHRAKAWVLQGMRPAMRIKIE